VALTASPDSDLQEAVSNLAGLFLVLAGCSLLLLVVMHWNVRRAFVPLQALLGAIARVERHDLVAVQAPPMPIRAADGRQQRCVAAAPGPNAQRLSHQPGSAHEHRPACRASRASLAVRIERQADQPGVLDWSVQDNGCGLADKAAALHRGSGLAGLKDRVWALGGELRWTSGEAGGLKLEAKLPVADRRSEDVR
jgi:hypothetical protein